MPQTILYYPKIDIQDSAWLRNAILYWDEVSSIVPYERYGNLSLELQYLKNLGVYSPIYPQDLFESNYVNDFCHTVVKRIDRYSRSLDKKNNNLSNTRVRIHKNKIYAPALFELIHYKKIPKDLLAHFRDRRFINDYNLDGWMEIDSSIAQIYMRTLAEYSIKCSDKDIVLGTDTSILNQEIYHRVPKHSGTQNQCFRININHCLPQPAMDVSFEDILNFKEKRKDELYAFKQKIRELEKNVSESDSLEAIRFYENQFIESWEPHVNDLHKALTSSGIRFFVGSLISLVATPLFTEQLSPVVANAVLTGIAGIKIVMDYIDYRDKTSPAKTDGGFSYIIKAREEGIICASPPLSSLS